MSNSYIYLLYSEKNRKIWIASQGSHWPACQRTSRILCYEWGSSPKSQAFWNYNSRRNKKPGSTWSIVFQKGWKSEKVKGVIQEEKKIHGWFVKALKEAHTNIDPSTSEGQSLLGQHFISQSTLDNRWKLQSYSLFSWSILPCLRCGLWGCCSETKLRRKRIPMWKVQANTHCKTVNHCCQTCLQISGSLQRGQESPATKKFQLSIRGRTNKGEFYKHKLTGHQSQDC